MSRALHDPPGFVEDLTEPYKKAWSERVSSFMHTKNVSPQLTPQFYDATKVQEKGPISTQKITWFGFPQHVQKLLLGNARQRWEEADRSRLVQDEYLEWSIQRDDNGKMLKIVFCNEGPEYFKHLGESQPYTLLDLYRTLNPGFDIKKEDIFDQYMIYKQRNKWNNSTTTGTIMHLIHPANNLHAEIDIAGAATVLRKRHDGTLIEDPDELMGCSKYGKSYRNSDHQIGAEINALARCGAMLTIDNPVGLYIDSIDCRQIEPPHGHSDDLSQFWKWSRGSEGYRMRAELEIPKGKGYVLGDVLVQGCRLQFGGQLADLIKVSLTGRASDVSHLNRIQPCFCGQRPTSSGKPVSETINVGSQCNPWTRNGRAKLDSQIVGSHVME